MLTTVNAGGSQGIQQSSAHPDWQTIQQVVSVVSAHFGLERALSYLTLWGRRLFRIRNFTSSFFNLPPITRVSTVNATYLTMHISIKNYGDVSNTLWQKFILIHLFVWKIFKKNYASQALKWLVVWISVP